MKLLALGIDVILENGFWLRDERLNFLKAAKKVDPKGLVILHYLDIPVDCLWERLQKRNANLPNDCFHITKEELTLWMTWFTPPNDEELKLYDDYVIHGVC